MYCSKCGNHVNDGVAFCPACGQPTGTLATPNPVLPAGTTATASPGLAPGDYPAGVYASTSAPPVAYGRPSVQYAGFWLRFVAYIIDGIIMGLVFAALFIPFAIVTGLGAALGKISTGEDARDLIGGTVILGILVVGCIAFLAGWLYHAKMESSSWQATLGKRALNLKVTDMAGAPVTFARASGRYFAKIITGLIPLGIGYMLAGFTERRQALHDMIASCLVLKDG